MLMQREKEPYICKTHVRVVTATSLFDGHDASINIMRRILQASGAEVIHLGHNRSTAEVVEAAIHEDAQAIAVTCYQGGHVEYFKYMKDLLEEKNCGHIKLFGGGGGVILPEEVKELHDYGITRIYSPDDGRSMGLQGMINDLLEKSDYFVTELDFPNLFGSVEKREHRAIARAISWLESAAETPTATELRERSKDKNLEKTAPILGVTGTGGAGKSSLVDELLRRFLIAYPDINIGVLSVDPTKRKTGGALLGDRIRMNALNTDRVFMRSLATRQSHLSLSKHVGDVMTLMQSAGFDLLILESSGIGQSDSEIVDFADLALYVMTPEYGAATQLEKIDMIDFADVIALNKFDRRGANDALRDVKKQYKRGRKQFDLDDDKVPVFGTIASQFNDTGTTRLVRYIDAALYDKCNWGSKASEKLSEKAEGKIDIVPPKRVRYLSEIADTIRDYNKWVDNQALVANKLQALVETKQIVSDTHELEEKEIELNQTLDPGNKKLLEAWPEKKSAYENDVYAFNVRDKKVEVKTYTESLSHTKVPKVSLPEYTSWGDLLKWQLQENVPGEFPFTSGVFPFKRENEDPTRMFAGEGGPERTNRRFHYVSAGMPAQRLSTAFDSVTLYGDDPHKRPDIYGKVGNAGVSICCLDDAKKLYSGFDLCKPTTSVSMTINGPAPLILGFFLNAAIDQQCELYIKANGLETEVKKKIADIYKGKGIPQPSYRGDIPQGNDGLGLMLLGVTGDQVLPKDVYDKIKAEALNKVRGTVQADILKEDQAQNTCIFSTDFALKLMGDVQEYFVQHEVRNFYSVSISGYHIAEAGANPITQLAFTLANGFTYVEYYLSRGMSIDSFAPNLSFFFSNGVDPEYAVIGRVARRIWSKAMKRLYSASERSQKLKYHIQTSGRSLHAQEVAFNDIRTTLQAMYALFDNCNSLHTNAYDEAITTPTEESVRRAIAIQLIINHELGISKNQNPWQGSFIIEKLTDLVEAAVLEEFDRITERGGVLGAMETMYQRGKIQEESLYYEHQKHTGEYPIIGVNRFLSSEGSPTVIPGDVMRSTEEEKMAQIETVENLKKASGDKGLAELKRLQQAALNNDNIFNAVMETSKYCSLGQMTTALYQVGGKYRRNM